MASGHEPGELTWVSVRGGRLAVEVNSGDTEPVLAIHGLSSQRKLWNWLRASAPGLTPESLPAVFASRLARMNREFGSVREYAEFFTASTAPLLDPDDPLLLGYLAHDLFGSMTGARATADLIAEALGEKAL
jgi:hypothetical protein